MTINKGLASEIIEMMRAAVALNFGPKTKCKKKENSPMILLLVSLSFPRSVHLLRINQAHSRRDFTI